MMLRLQPESPDFWLNQDSQDYKIRRIRENPKNPANPDSDTHPQDSKIRRIRENPKIRQILIQTAPPTPPPRLSRTPVI